MEPMGVCVYIYIYIYFKIVKPIYECKRGSNKLFIVGGIKLSLFKLRSSHERK